MDVRKQLVIPGSFELYCGPMKSGKSAALLYRIDKIKHNKIEFITIKPKIDTRNNHIHSRFSDLTFDCTIVDEQKPEEIFNYIKNEKAVIIDEIMFFNDKIVNVVKELLRDKLSVIAAGLDTNFRGEPFGPMPYLLCIADYVEKLEGTCEYKNCKNLANRTQRLINGQPAHYNDPLITIEGKNENETYECRCLEHHFVPGRPY